MKSFESIWIRVFTGLIIGVIISYVDNFLFEGEVSPIVIVLLLLIATIGVGVLWRWKGVIISALIWIWLPITHITKKVFDLPDTLHPNTYKSIFMLTIFTFSVSSIGFLLGVSINRLLKRK